jgi:hypothetical protein
MRPRQQIIESLNEGIGPFTEASVVHSKALEAILETLLDIRDLQSALDEKLLKAKAPVKRGPG